MSEPQNTVIARPTMWICDTCGQPIKSVMDGWVEWISRFDEISTTFVEHGLRLVHHCSVSGRHPGCQYDGKACHVEGELIKDVPLHRFVGDDGLMLLLGEIADEDRGIRASWIELCKRLHVPGYDESRGYMDQAVRDGLLSPARARAPGIYTQEEIIAVIKYARDMGLDRG